jgi:hypothetical protein
MLIHSGLLPFFGAYPSYDILKNAAFRNLDLFSSSGRREGGTVLGPLVTCQQPMSGD